MSEKTNPFLSKSIGKPDTGSRGKAEKASKRANEEIVNEKSDSWPTAPSGLPYVKAEMAASELIPTGQYANVSIGPVRLHFLIDPGIVLQDENGGPTSFFSPQQRATIAQALNEAAEIVEVDVCAVQRNLIMESMQQQLGEK